VPDPDSIMDAVVVASVEVGRGERREGVGYGEADEADQHGRDHAG
jgi:hypothetical protein